MSAPARRFFSHGHRACFTRRFQLEDSAADGRRQLSHHKEKHWTSTHNVAILTAMNRWKHPPSATLICGGLGLRLQRLADCRVAGKDERFYGFYHRSRKIPNWRGRNPPFRISPAHGASYLLTRFHHALRRSLLSPDLRSVTKSPAFRHSSGRQRRINTQPIANGSPRYMVEAHTLLFQPSQTHLVSMIMKRRF